MSRQSKQILERLGPSALARALDDLLDRKRLVRLLLEDVTLLKANPLTSRYDRLRQAGKLTPQEIAKELDIDITTLKLWRQAGRVQAYVYNDKGECLYEPLGADRPVKYDWYKTQRQKPATHL